MVSLRNTVPPVAPSGHRAKTQWPVSSTVLPWGQMHAPIISSPSRHGAGVLQLPSLPSTCPCAHTDATQLPWGSRTSLSPQPADAADGDDGATDAEALPGAAGDASGAGDARGAAGGGSIVAGGAGLPAHATSTTPRRAHFMAPF